ncbi:MAG TPA: hypothetical protein VOA87_01950 [Thermoanaerobaculia bacterium]|nr:hypothetical protein [Thermoanaerobaculia bacterium]
MIRKNRRWHDLRPAGLLGLLGLLTVIAACSGGGSHSSPVEPVENSLMVQSVSPMEGTAVPVGSTFSVSAQLRYHLEGAATGELHTDLLRANGKPLNQPDIQVAFPLFQPDGTVSVSLFGRIPTDAGTEVLVSISLFAQGGVHPPVHLTLHYPVSS